MQDYTKSNYDSQQYVLGGSLQNPALAKKAVKKVDHNVFDDYRDRMIFLAIKENLKQGKTADEITVFEYLRGKGLTEKIPVAYFGVLKDVFVSEANFDYHLDRVKQAADARQELELFERIKMAHNNGGNAEVIAELRGQLTKLWEGVNGKPSEIISLREHQPEERKWLLKPGFPDQFPSIIYGDGGLGKSYLATYLGILAATGKQTFLGLEFPQNPLNVLYLDWELDIDEFSRRSLMVGKGLELSELPANLYYYSPDKNLYKLIPELKGLIKTKKIQFLIMDSLGAACVDPENVGDIVELFGQIKNLGIATLILDHQSKMQSQDNYNTKTPYGSVYKFNLSRSVFQLSCLGREGNKISLMLRHKKSNFGQLLEDLLFDISFEGDRVMFYESQSLGPEEKDMIIIHESMTELEGKGETINQKNLVINLKGVLGRNTILSLLNKGEGQFWEKVSPNKRDFVYRPIPISLKFTHIYNRTTKLIENSNDSEDIIDIVPEVIR